MYHVRTSHVTNFRLSKLSFCIQTTWQTFVFLYFSSRKSLLGLPTTCTLITDTHYQQPPPSRPISRQSIVVSSELQQHENTNFLKCTTKLRTSYPYVRTYFCVVMVTSFQQFTIELLLLLASWLVINLLLSLLMVNIFELGIQVPISSRANVALFSFA